MFENNFFLATGTDVFLIPMLSILVQYENDEIEEDCIVPIFKVEDFLKLKESHRLNEIFIFLFFSFSFFFLFRSNLLRF